MHTLTLIVSAVADETAGINGLTNAQAWSVLLGILTPFLISVVQQPRWTPTVRRVMAIVVAVGVAVINLVVQGALDLSTINGGTILTSLVGVVGASQAAYSLLWKPTGVTDKVEEATGGPYEGKHAA